MVACRKCTECKAAKRRHWVGRINAEMQTAKTVTFATFTYGDGDGNGSDWLDYKDLQKAFKRLRRAEYYFRYVAVGEYGGKNQRAHFHALIFWQSDEPPVPMDCHVYPEDWTPNKDPHRSKVTQDFWPNGFLQFERPRSRQGSAAYIMKYLDKGDLPFSYSKLPALGTEYLLQYARQHAVEGLSLFEESDRFTIPSNVRANGELYYYPVGRSTAVYSQMIEAFCDEWFKLRRNQPMKLSQEVRDFLWEASQAVDRQPAAIQWAARQVFDVFENPWTYEHVDGPFFKTDTYVVELNDRGIPIWREKLGDVANKYLQAVRHARRRAEETKRPFGVSRKLNRSA